MSGDDVVAQLLDNTQSQTSLKSNISKIILFGIPKRKNFRELAHRPKMVLYYDGEKWKLLVCNQNLNTYSFKIKCKQEFLQNLQQQTATRKIPYRFPFSQEIII